MFFVRKFVKFQEKEIYVGWEWMCYWTACAKVARHCCKLLYKSVRVHVFTTSSNMLSKQREMRFWCD